MRWHGDQIAAAARAGGRAGLAAAAQAVLAASQAQVPVDSGELRASGRATVAGDRATVAYGAAHAGAVHEGTRGGAGRPFLRTALNGVDAAGIISAHIHL